ncbi:uncharacterized protein PITG_13148 [Phytophthora infestans T30-4]|uniref:Uncharacterized protein n=1 Tax=Phytophthora infestans (strain T30-4) TaxID=403677 RepID=D0NJP7_PHYIT|nr:uncharacterized protein PITG_13148 [Phytophthora infestans T30-4]EEY59983.1 conserved hypothetical protein [Phytophthora infestans T30-4]|eukprot:XP_002900668.1 conserved hypothetical protein [Phytophthora infestans T30-4]
MSSRSKRMLSRVAQVSIVFLVLYCFTAVVIWIKWAEMKDLNFEARDITTLDVEDESGEYPDQAWKKNEFQCLGWVETDDDGDESGARRECWQRIQAGDAGYCEVMNTSSGQVLRVMQTTSLSLKDDARFTCELAQSFSSFRFRAMAYRHDPPMTLDPLNSQGIIMAVYENVLPSAFASVRRLRDVGCTLPIELWFRHNELLTDNPVLLLLTEKYGPIHLRQVFDERIFGFNVKVHALYYSHFTSVLLLDADNFAVKNPTPLFSSRAMKQYGAVFWPDFWHPGNSIFNLHAQSLVWELLGLEYVDMPEQESGQVLVDRAVSKPMLEQLMYYATHTPNLFSKLKLVWGDKDLFRLTWLQMRKKFYYNDRRVPGTLGIVNHDRRRYCGVTMVQYDLNGQDMLFWHRNTIKLSGRDDRRVWHTLQELHAVDSSWLPKIQSFNGKKVFNETSCFGVKRFEMNGFVQMKRVDELGDILASLENTLIIYARQAYELLDNDDLD